MDGGGGGGVRGAIRVQRHRSIRMARPKFGAQAQQQGHTLELGEPVGDGRGDFIRRDRRARQWARGPQVAGRDGAVAGDGAIAHQRDELEVFVHEEGDRNAQAAADADGAGEVRVSVAFEEAEVDAGRCVVARALRPGREARGDRREDRNLLHAIAAPTAADAEDIDAPREGADEFALRRGERDALRKRLPVGAFVGLGGGEVCGVADPGGEG